MLDGVIQCTQKDEFSYQEMLVHPAMFTHPNPCRVSGKVYCTVASVFVIFCDGPKIGEGASGLNHLL